MLGLFRGGVPVSVFAISVFSRAQQWGHHVAVFTGVGATDRLKHDDKSAPGGEGVCEGGAIENLMCF